MRLGIGIKKQIKARDRNRKNETSDQNHKTNEDSGSKMHPDKNPACALASVFKNNFSK
jgi:hypothetical protein